jgi:hypothetical protein
VLNYILSSPVWLSILALFIITLSYFIFRKRKLIIQGLKKWKFSEIAVGPVTLKTEKKDSEQKNSPGVIFKSQSDFSESEISEIAGQDILQGINAPSEKDNKETSSVIFDGSNFKKAKISKIAGRNIVTNGESNKIEKGD